MQRKRQSLLVFLHALNQINSTMNDKTFVDDKQELFT